MRSSGVRRPGQDSQLGFTLIELLVVIVILGILMAVAVPTFLRQQTKAQDSRTQQYLMTAFKAIRSGLPDTNNQYPSSTSMVSWIQQSEPELTAQRGDCLTGVTSAPVDAVLVDPSSTANSLQLCARSQSGNVWKLTASATGVQQLLDGTVVPLTVSGNEITDATRAADVQGDGLSNDSSTGIWEGTTNLVTNGGFESNTNGWANNGDLTLTRVSATAKFGSSSLKVQANSAGDTSSAIYNWSGTMLPVIAGNTYAASAWVLDGNTGGKQVVVDLAWRDSSQTLVASNYGTAVTLSGTWQRLAVTATAPANAAYADIYVQGVAPTWLSNGDYYYVDGVQVEPQPIATPYVETDGTTATRAPAGITAPAALLDPSQGWWAARIRVGFSSSYTADQAIIARWRDSGNSENYTLMFQPSDGAWIMLRRSASINVEAVFSGVTFAPGDGLTIVGSWGAGEIGVSVNGAPFVTAAAAAASPGASTFGIGIDPAGLDRLLNSDVFWFACGTGTLTDADAATINSWGNSDPARSSFPTSAQATMVWNGVGATGSLK